MNFKGSKITRFMISHTKSTFSGKDMYIVHYLKSQYCHSHLDTTKDPILLNKLSHNWGMFEVIM